eukprot:ctg_1302.g554
MGRSGRPAGHQRRPGRRRSGGGQWPGRPPRRGALDDRGEDGCTRLDASSVAADDGRPELAANTAFSSTLRPASSCTSSRPHRSLGLLQLVGMIFFMTSGGGYGLEPMLGAAGPLLTLIGLCVAPWLWALPQALMASELSTLMPEDGSAGGVSQTPGGQCALSAPLLRLSIARLAGATAAGVVAGGRGGAGAVHDGERVGGEPGGLGGGGLHPAGAGSVRHYHGTRRCAHRPARLAGRPTARASAVAPVSGVNAVELVRVRLVLYAGRRDPSGATHVPARHVVGVGAHLGHLHAAYRRVGHRQQSLGRVAGRVLAPGGRPYRRRSVAGRAVLPRRPQQRRRHAQQPHRHLVAGAVRDGAVAHAAAIAWRAARPLRHSVGVCVAGGVRHGGVHGVAVQSAGADGLDPVLRENRAGVCVVGAVAATMARSRAPVPHRWWPLGFGVRGRLRVVVLHADGAAERAVVGSGRGGHRAARPGVASDPRGLRYLRRVGVAGGKREQTGGRCGGECDSATRWGISGG